MRLTYIFHSGFALETDDAILVFDYWLDPARKNRAVEMRAANGLPPLPEPEPVNDALGESPDAAVAAHDLPPGTEQVDAASDHEAPVVPEKPRQLRGPL